MARSSSARLREGSRLRNNFPIAVQWSGTREPASKRKPSGQADVTRCAQHRRRDDTEAELHQSCARNEPPLAWLALQQTLVLEHANDAVCRWFRHALQDADLGHAERAARRRQGLDNRECLDRRKRMLRRLGGRTLTGRAF